MIIPDPSKSIEEQDEQALYRMVVWGEARGEKIDGQVAVAHVIHNRLARSPGKTLKDVLLHKFAFSCLNIGDPNRDKLRLAHQLNPWAYTQIDHVCDGVEHALLLDSSNGATHYCTRALWGTDNFQWYGAHEIRCGHTRKTAEIGNHIFAIAPGDFA